MNEKDKGNKMINEIKEFIRKGEDDGFSLQKVELYIVNNKVVVELLAPNKQVKRKVFNIGVGENINLLDLDYIIRVDSFMMNCGEKHPANVEHVEQAFLREQRVLEDLEDKIENQKKLVEELEEKFENYQEEYKEKQVSEFRKENVKFFTLIHKLIEIGFKLNHIWYDYSRGMTVIKVEHPDSINKNTFSIQSKPEHVEVIEDIVEDIRSLI